jgi:site-specific DNA recombinase
MKVAIYVRVSTQRQAQAQTSAQQLERLRAHLQAENYELSDQDIFDDEGYSGALLKRPALDRLRDAVGQNRFDRLLITAPDRLARNYVHQVLLLEELQAHGCKVEFLDRPLSQDPHDQLLLQVRGAVAEYERTLIVERTRRGRLAKLKAGSLLPWTLPPYSYRTDPDRPRDPRTVRIDEAQGVIVQELFARYLQPGVSLYSLANLLHVRGVATPRGQRLWNLGTLRGILSNPAYTGLLYAQRKEPKPVLNRRSPLRPVGQTPWRYVEQPPEHWLLGAQIPPLSSQEQFQQVQEKLSHNQRCAKRNNNAHDYLLRALVSCGHCQLTATGRTSGDHSYYVCKGKGPAIWSRREQKCPGRSIPASQLDQLVWRDLCEVLDHPSSLRYGLERAHGGHWEPEYLQKRRAQLQAGQAQLQRQLERLTEAYLSSVVPLAEYQRRRQDLEQQFQSLQQTERQLDADSQQQSRVSELAQSIEDFAARVRGSLEQASFEQKRQLVELLIDRVIVTDDKVEIRYVIPTTPVSEQVRFCHLRTDYLTRLAHRVNVQREYGINSSLDKPSPSRQLDDEKKARIKCQKPRYVGETEAPRFL